MQTIEVDEKVFSYLQSVAKPLVDTPNTVLLRILGLDEASDAITAAGSKSKAPKADLRVLVANGALRNGQVLTLLNHSHEPQAYRAKVNGTGLDYDGGHFSMSALAQKLLIDLGFADASVRGPAHWATADGTTVNELWQAHLAILRQ